MTKPKIRKLVRHYLKHLKLDDWRCTRLVLSTNPMIGSVQVYGWCEVCSVAKKTFHLGLRIGLEGPELNKVIVHEIVHIATQMFENAVKADNKVELNKWEEYLAEMAERLVF